MSENEPNLEEEKPKEIKDASNIDELKEILLQKKEIVESKEDRYSAVDIIMEIQNMKEMIDRSVRGGGISKREFRNWFNESSEMMERFTSSEELKSTVSRLLTVYMESEMESKGRP